MKNLNTFILEKFKINKDTKLASRKPQNNDEMACKELADICKETLFLYKGYKLPDKAFSLDDNNKDYIINNPKYFNDDLDIVKEFYRRRSGILKSAISCSDSYNLKRISLPNCKTLNDEPFVEVHLNGNHIEYIAMSESIKDWLV